MARIALFLGGILLWVIAMWKPSVDDVLAATGEVAPLPAAVPALRAPASSLASAAVARPAPGPRAQEEMQPAQEPAMPPPPAAPDPSLTPPPEMLGPIDERKQIFASEPRDSNATDAEELIHKAFQRKDIPPALYRSVMCRQTICKLELRWRPERADGYMLGLMQIMTKFEPGMAVDPSGPDSSGDYQVDVYLRRLIAAPTPEHLD